MPGKIASWGQVMQNVGLLLKASALSFHQEKETHGTYTQGDRLLFRIYNELSLLTDIRQGVSYSDDICLAVLTKFCTSNRSSKNI